MFMAEGPEGSVSVPEEPLPAPEEGHLDSCGTDCSTPLEGTPGCEPQGWGRFRGSTHEARATENVGDVTPRGPAALLSTEVRVQLPQKEPEFTHAERHLRRSKKRRHWRFPQKRPLEERAPANPRVLRGSRRQDP